MMPRDVMRIPVETPGLWATDSDDLLGLALAEDGLVTLHKDRVEGHSNDGETLWSIALQTEPIPWGLALTVDHCVVTLTDGQVVCLASEEK